MAVSEAGLPGTPPRRWAYGQPTDSDTAGAERVARVARRSGQHLGGAEPAFSGRSAVAAGQRALAATVPRGHRRALRAAVGRAAVVGRALLGRPRSVAGRADRRATGRSAWLR